MKYRNPLTQILSQTRSHWDRDEARSSVRRAFRSALLCRTPALGAEVYASENQERIVYHTCKSRACPSCGYRATVQWQRERWAALPDAMYKGITFTVPDLFWQLFRDHPPLARALPALAANVIQAWVSARYGLRVGVIAILHTFNGRLEFNSHVHTMVTAGGLQASGSWTSRVYYGRDSLMESWRNAVIKLVRTALRAGLLHTELTADQMEAMLVQQGNRWWSIHIQSLGSKERFLRYAGRYVRRPPIAQRRIICIGERSVTYCTKDKRLGHRITVQCSPEEFIDRWAQHIPERYQHAVRCFGLLAPRALRQTSAAIFAILRQKRRPRPKPLRWAEAIKRDFGKDPLLDSSGKKMTWVRRIAPESG
ncbi:MAG: transposase [Acidobacteriia bacterium]|nr:transposase [Terriglobia bacterium]